MANTHKVSFKLNGKGVEVAVEPRELLIHTLREKLAHTGPHIGCETTHCGACTVDLDGMELQKKPGIAETLDWTAALLRLGISVIDVDGSERIIETLSALIKTRDDRAAFPGEVIARLAAAC